MKFLSLAMLPMALMLGVYTNSISASEHVEVRERNGNTEFRMKVHHRNGHYYGVRDGREFRLRGDAVVRFHDDGEYYVTGREVGDEFEVVETRPYVVEERRVIEERPVVREREVIRERDPFIKVGPLEIK